MCRTFLRVGHPSVARFQVGRIVPSAARFQAGCIFLCVAHFSKYEVW